MSPSMLIGCVCVSSHQNHRKVRIAAIKNRNTSVMPGPLAALVTKLRDKDKECRMLTMDVFQGADFENVELLLS